MVKQSDDTLRSRLSKNKSLKNTYRNIQYFYNKYCISDIKLLEKKFKKNIGRDLDIVNPISYNDKLQWLKLNWFDSKAITCADKFEVRQYVSSRIGDKYLNELYGIFNSVDEIEIDKFPKSFVLKGTHGSGFNIICENKDNMNWHDELVKMKRWLKTNYYWGNREWIYKDIKPRIICEKFLSEMDGGLPKDYKFFCFNGEPKFLFLASDRGIDTKFDFYDLEWNKIPVAQYYPNSNYSIPKPEKLEEMIELARILSEGFPHVRVDFYVIDNNIIFGEMTFFHFSGTKKFEPDKFDKIFGDYLDISKIIKTQN